MKIKKIMYYSVPKSESATCDCCGKSIQNICSITTVENEHFNFGSTCFDKVIKDKLQSFQRKEMNKSIKSIKAYCEQIEKWGNLTQEEYEQTPAYTMATVKQYGDPLSAFESFNELKTWMINEFFPYRLSEEEKIIARFSKIDF